MPGTLELERPLAESYSALLTAVWDSDEEAAKLAGDPTAYAGEMGLPVQCGATVKVVNTLDAGPYLEEQITADWTAIPGEHVLRVPAKPAIDIRDLTEDDSKMVKAFTIIIILPY
jgi:hypothetical protein